MMNPIRFGLAVAATASLGFAHGDGVGKNGDENPLLDNLWQDGIKVSYTPGSGVTFASADKKDFSLTISGRLQAKYYYSSLENAQSVSSFKARRVRTKFAGNVFNEDIRYYVQLEHTAAPNVLDAWTDWRFSNSEDSELGFRIGLQKFRAGLQSDNSSSNLEFSERSIASRTFADKRGLGGLLHGGLMNSDNGHKLQWHVGVLNGQTAAGIGDGAGGSVHPAALNESNELNFTAGMFFAPNGLKGGTEKHVEGDLVHSGNFETLFGANLFFGNDNFGAGIGDIETLQINGFASMKTGAGLAAQGEIFLRNDDADGGGDADSMGWYAQGSYTMAPGEGTQWGFGARVAMVTIDDVNPLLSAKPSLEGSSTAAMVATGDIMEITGGASAYYHKHKLKTQINYVYQSVDADAGTDSDNHGIDVLFTLLF